MPSISFFFKEAFYKKNMHEIQENVSLHLKTFYLQKKLEKPKKKY